MGGDITPDEIAKGVQDLENQGLQTGEKALCQSAVDFSPGSGVFCGFVVKFPLVQWVNKKVVNLPIVGQVTHQIATLASGAVHTVEDTIKSAVGAVAKAASDAAKDLASTITNAAT